jgi:hypothetical protein
VHLSGHRELDEFCQFEGEGTTNNVSRKAQFVDLLVWMSAKTAICWSRIGELVLPRRPQGMAIYRLLLPDCCQATFIRQRNYVGIPLTLWLEYIAPALRADFPFNRCAAVRRLKQFALVALLVAFRRVLVRGLLLRHLAFCCRRLWA